jgi:hypothetical protein
MATVLVDVDRLTGVIARLVARKIEGPMDYDSDYYALFFEGPSGGNRFEIRQRKRAAHLGTATPATFLAL